MDGHLFSKLRKLFMLENYQEQFWAYWIIYQVIKYIEYCCKYLPLTNSYKIQYSIQERLVREYEWYIKNHIGIQYDQGWEVGMAGVGGVMVGKGKQLYLNNNKKCEKNHISIYFRVEMNFVVIQSNLILFMSKPSPREVNNK